METGTRHERYMMNLLNVFAVIAALVANAAAKPNCATIDMGAVMKECLEDEGIPSSLASKFAPVDGIFPLGKEEFDAMCVNERRFLTAGACIVGSTFHCKDLVTVFKPQLEQAAFLMDFCCDDPTVDRGCVAVGLIQSAKSVLACVDAKDTSNQCKKNKALLQCAVESINAKCTDPGATAKKFGDLEAVLKC